MNRAGKIEYIDATGIIEQNKAAASSGLTQAEIADLMFVEPWDGVTDRRSEERRRDRRRAS